MTPVSKTSTIERMPQAARMAIRMAMGRMMPVSYTHLTLPTNREV